MKVKEASSVLMKRDLEITFQLIHIKKQAKFKRKMNYLSVKVVWNINFQLETKPWNRISVCWRRSSLPCSSWAVLKRNHNKSLNFCGHRKSAHLLTLLIVGALSVLNLENSIAKNCF